MKIIDKMSYALWVYSNATSTTVGFYKLSGADYKDALPQVVAFNKAMKDKIEVQEPMEWGKARAHTWSEIRANGFDKDEEMFAHGGPDGMNMSDDDVFDYWNYVASTNCAEENSMQNKLDLLAHLRELSTGNLPAFSATVFELAEFVVSMYPHHEKEHLWIGLNYIRCANEIVRVLRAIPLAIGELCEGDLATFAMNNGPDVIGLLVAVEDDDEGKRQLAVTVDGEVWSVEATARGTVGTRLAPKVRDPDAHKDGVEATIDPAFYGWFPMPTAESALTTIANGPLKHLLNATAREMLGRATSAMATTMSARQATATVTAN